MKCRMSYYHVDSPLCSPGFYENVIELLSIRFCIEIVTKINTDSLCTGPRRREDGAS